MSEPPVELTPHAPAALPHGMIELNEDECRGVLSRQRLCVVSVVEGDAPYAVPVFYGFDGEALFLGVMDGRKTRALESNPRVCVVVTEVAADDTWRSVIVEGVVAVVQDPVARQHAVDVLIAHNRRRSGVAYAAPLPPKGTRSRHTGGRILRIRQVRMSGRTRR